jgi:hypothetical protein
VSLIDCDLNQPIWAWSRGTSRSTVRILGDVTESQIVPVIDTERAGRQFVLVRGLYERAALRRRGLTRAGRGYHRGPARWSRNSFAAPNQTPAV